jgi:hypothetical protein
LVNVRFVPTGDSCTAACARLFDHLVGTGEQRWWNNEAEGLRRLEVDDQFEFGWQYDWQVYGLDPGDNAARIGSGLTIGAKDARTVADKSPWPKN